MNSRLSLGIVNILLALGCILMLSSRAKAVTTVYVVPNSYSISMQYIGNNQWQETVILTVTNTSSAALRVRINVRDYLTSTNSFQGSGQTAYQLINPSGNTTLTFTVLWNLSSPFDAGAHYQIITAYTPAFTCWVGTTEPATLDSPHIAWTN